jgi:hypothetical protein
MIGRRGALDFEDRVTRRVGSGEIAQPSKGD